MSPFAALAAQKFQAFTASSGGNNEIVAAVSGKKIRVLALEGTINSPASLSIRSANTAISGPHPMSANGQKVLPMNEAGWFQTAAGEALNFDLSSAVQFGGSLVYQEVA